LPTKKGGKIVGFGLDEGGEQIPLYLKSNNIKLFDD
jgi:hypothetical protein